VNRIAPQTLDELRAHITELSASTPLRPYDAIELTLDSLTEARARGCSLDQIVAALARHGITLSRTTVRNYLSRARAARRRALSSAPQPATTWLAHPLRNEDATGDGSPSRPLIQASPSHKTHRKPYLRRGHSA
jgi:hypothetical protein